MTPGKKPLVLELLDFGVTDKLLSEGMLVFLTISPAGCQAPWGWSLFPGAAQARGLA